MPGAESLLGGYRFDDPAGAVGVETLLAVDGAGTVHQVPTLVGTCAHSVLGPRWVYDGTSDPVSVAATVAAILAARHQEELLVHGPAGIERREPVVLAWARVARPTAAPCTSPAAGHRRGHDAGAPRPLARPGSPALPARLARLAGDQPRNPVKITGCSWAHAAAPKRSR